MAGSCSELGVKLARSKSRSRVWVGRVSSRVCLLLSPVMCARENPPRRSLTAGGLLRRNKSGAALAPVLVVLWRLSCYNDSTIVAVSILPRVPELLQAPSTSLLHTIRFSWNELSFPSLRQQPAELRTISDDHAILSHLTRSLEGGTSRGHEWQRKSCTWLRHRGLRS